MYNVNICVNRCRTRGVCRALCTNGYKREMGAWSYVLHPSPTCLGTDVL